MIKFTQSFRKWLWDNHQDKFAIVLFGHTEMVTEEMYQDYLAWVQTDEGRKYLKGGEYYDDNDKLCNTRGTMMTNKQAIKELNTLAWNEGGPYRETVLTAINIAIQALQTDIVRCKDCKHNLGETTGGKSVVCNYCTYGMLTERNNEWYCADGERREP